VRHLKIVGLSCLAALTAMAMVGASTASATGSTALCTVDQTPCAAGNLVKHIHEVGTGVKLLTNIVTVTCTGLFLGDVLSPFLANPLHIVGNFTYSGCKDASEGSCEAKELSASSLITVLRTAAEKSEITGEGEVLVKCGSFLHCVYNGKSLKGEGLGALLAAPNGEAKTEEATTNKVSGFLCPSTSKLDALYKPLTPTYIST
jgi:hypothetical protein